MKTYGLLRNAMKRSFPRSNLQRPGISVNTDNSGIKTSPNEEPSERSKSPVQRHRIPYRILTQDNSHLPTKNIKSASETKPKCTTSRCSGYPNSSVQEQAGSMERMTQRKLNVNHQTHEDERNRGSKTLAIPGDIDPPIKRPLRELLDRRGPHTPREGWTLFSSMIDQPAPRGKQEERDDDARLKTRGSHLSRRTSIRQVAGHVAAVSRGRFPAGRQPISFLAPVLRADHPLLFKDVG